MLPINVRQAVVLTEALRGHIPYGWAKKVGNRLTLAQFIAQAHAGGVDCSGFICWLLYQISSGRYDLSLGSWQIADHFAALLPKKRYAEVAGLRDGVFRLCGFPPVGKEAGHVWGVVDGLTLESHGKNAHGNGVDRRPWNTPVLMKATWCYELSGPTAPAVLPAPSAPALHDLAVRDAATGAALHTEKGAVLISQGHAYVLATALPEALGWPMTLDYQDGVLTIRRGPNG